MSGINATRGKIKRDTSVPLEFDHIYYNKIGQVVHDEKDAIAKIIISNQTGIKKYFILSMGNTLYDVQNISPNYRSQSWKMTKVTQDKFDMYIRFLVTTRKVHLTRAQRL